MELAILFYIQDIKKFRRLHTAIVADRLAETAEIEESWTVCGGLLLHKSGSYGC